LASQTQNGYTFDGIICDVPCTGSGTWARTPEQIEVFKTETISTFKLKQQAIVRNASQSLRKNGILVYITCSVFKDENENQVKYIQENLNLTLIESNLIEGAKQHADTMFVAVFKKEI
jgi:16S rRNA (cytosine967-C5)-methyltransferase